MGNLIKLSEIELKEISGGGDDAGWRLLGKAAALSYYINPITGPYLLAYQMLK